VRAWIAARDADELGTSVLVLGEIARGVAALRRRDPAQAALLETWSASLLANFAGRILPIDWPVADRWAQLGSMQPVHVVDSLIAATAMVHGLAVVSRNARDFARLGAQVVDPFAA
jgi:predicted nucleic acid-binding protein